MPTFRILPEEHRLTTLPGARIQTIDRDLKVPYSEQFSMGIQRTLPWGLFAEGNFVGTLGRHLLVEPDINQPTFATLASVPTSTNENSIRPYPGYSTIQMFLSEATSNYYGMQLSLSRRKGPHLLHHLLHLLQGSDGRVIRHRERPRISINHP